MSASGTLDLDVRLTQVIPGGDGSDAANQIHRLSKFLTTAKTFGGATTPPIAEVWSDTVDLAAGTATIDLNALTRPAPQSALDADTLELIIWGFAGATANTAGIEVAPDATNGYNLFGTADDKVTVYPGQIVVGYSTTQKDLPTVAGGSADEITFTGTGTEQIHCLLAFG